MIPLSLAVGCTSAASLFGAMPAHHGPGAGFASAGSVLVLLGALVLGIAIAVFAIVRVSKKRS